METYSYRARGRDGEIFTDSMEAEDREAVAESLRDGGFLVIDVQKRPARRRGILQDVEFARKVRAQDLVIFTRQLATMIEAGIPLVRSLEVLGVQSESLKLGEVVARVRRDIEGGSSFSEALRKRQDVFGALYVEMVRAGESGGALDEVLIRVASQLEREQELRRQVRSAMIYPVFVLAAALVASVFMLVFVVPVFAQMYDDLGGTLPFPTRIAVFLSSIVSGPVGFIFIGFVAIGAVFLRRWIISEEGRRRMGTALLRMPFGVGKLVLKVSLARVARTFGSLLSTGVPVLQAMEITAAASGNPVVRADLMKCRESVGRGEQIHVALGGEPVFPSMMIRMVAVGEETGNLDGMLSKVADFYESEVESAVRSLTSMIEPVLILIVGGIVGATIISMYLPMFNIFELI